MPEFPLSKGDGTEPSVKIVRWKKVKVEKIWTVARKSTVTAEARELHTEERRILRRVGRTIKHSLSGSSPLVLQTPINLPLFFLCFLSSETLALVLQHSPPSFFLFHYPKSIWEERFFSFSTFLSGYTGSLITHFFQTIARPMSWPKEVRLFCPLQCHVVFLLLCLL